MTSSTVPPVRALFKADAMTPMNCGQLNDHVVEEGVVDCWCLPYYQRWCVVCKDSVERCGNCDNGLVDATHHEAIEEPWSVLVMHNHLV